MPPSHVRGWVTVAAVTAVSALASACSSSPSSPFDSEMVAAPVSVPTVDSLELSQHGVSGFGRAVWAQSSATGLTAVITTTGVFVVDGVESSPTQIDSFGSSTTVAAAAFAEDASRLAIAIGSPLTIRQFDIASGALVAEHDLPPDLAVRSLSYRPPNGVLVADTTQGLVEWLDPPPGPPVLPPESVPAGASAVLPDGTTITPLTGTSDLRVAGDGAVESVSLSVPDGMTVLDAESSPDGTVLGVTVGAGENVFERSDTIIVLNAVTFEPLGSIEVGRAIDAPAWSVADTAVAIVDESSLSVWTLDGVAVGGSSLDVPIDSIDPVAGGFVTVGRDGRVVMWADGNWEPITIGPGGARLGSAEVGASGRAVTTVDFYGAVTTWDIVNRVMVAGDERFAGGEATGVAINEDGSVVAASFSSGRVDVLDRDLTELWSFRPSGPDRRVDAVAVNPVTGTLVTGVAERLGDLAFDDTVTTWDVTRRAELFGHGGEGEDVGGCAFFNARVRVTSDGGLLATASHDFGVTVTDAVTGALLHELPGSTTILDLGFSPDADLMVATYDDAMVRVWDTADFSEVSSYRSPTAYFAIGLRPDSETMAVVDVLGAVSIVDIFDGSMVRPLPGGSYRAPALAVSPDGSVVAVPTADAAVAFWSAATGNLLVSAAQHAGPVTDLVFSSDGTRLVSSSQDGTVRSWQVVARG